MTKVFPASLPSSVTGKTLIASNGTRSCSEAKIETKADEVGVLTVWKKSLLLNCSGFTVFDGRGNLIYRVDNYAAGNRGEIVLMDAGGKPILTMRRKRLILGESWTVYDGENTSEPRFSVYRQANFRRTKTLAHVSSRRTPSPKKNVAYKIEGSYTQRSVSVYDSTRRCVAEIRRKEAASGVALGVDVFKLIIVQPYIDSAIAMALVILLDQMFGSSAMLLSR